VLLLFVGLAIASIAAGILVSAGIVQELPKRIPIAISVVKGELCRVPTLARTCSVSIMAGNPKINPQCVYADEFKDLADAQIEAIGPCISDVGYDEFGNAMQFSTEGVLFWQKDSNTVYFLVNSSVYANIQAAWQLLSGEAS
jgi:hypothetical protein